jgi:hypothetical protein
MTGFRGWGSIMFRMGLDADFYEEDGRIGDLLDAFDSADERGTTERPANRPAGQRGAGNRPDARARTGVAAHGRRSDQS